MAIQLKYGSDLNKLVDDLLDQPAPDEPLQEEYIIVPNPGMGRWLSFKIAESRGICANIEFPTIQNFINSLIELTSGQAESPDFSINHLSWRIFDYLKENLDHDNLGRLQSYLSNKPDIFYAQLSQKLAELFDQYLTYRPDWILAWELGKWITKEKSEERKNEIWQRHIWQVLTENSKHHRVNCYKALVKSLSNGLITELPKTIPVFGVNNLRPFFLKILKALSSHHNVILYLNQPTPLFWGDHPSSHQLKNLLNSSDRLSNSNINGGVELEVGNPWLASWGSQGKDLFNLLLDEELFTTEVDDLSLFNEPHNKHNLARVQRSIYNLSPKVDSVKRLQDDASISLHSYHHPLREIEGLQDYLLEQLSSDPTLKPSDILVLAPNIETYSSIIDAVFGNPESPKLKLPYSIADKPYVAESQTVETFISTLKICQGRFKVDEVLDLLHSKTFCSRFKWTNEDLKQISDWLANLGTSWGRSGEHRKQLDLPNYDSFTWKESLFQLIQGYAISPNACQSHVFNGVEGQDSLLMGKLCQAFEILDNAATLLAKIHPLQDWADLINQLIIEPLFNKDNEDSMDLRQIRETLLDLKEATNGLRSTSELSTFIQFFEISIQDGIPSRGFLGKGITFGRLYPMRAIPHRIVCLIGMDLKSFPRKSKNSNFDLMEVDYLRRTGDRSSYQSDRYIFLETLLSAKDKFYLSYCGFSPRNDSILPPAIPVDELLQEIEKDLPKPKNGILKRPLGVEHHLQAHHINYFINSKDNPLFSFSQNRFEAAKVEKNNTVSNTPQIGEINTKISDLDFSIIEIDDLIKFLSHPAQGFCQRTLGLSLPYNFKGLNKSEPLIIDGLTRYQLLANEDPENLSTRLPAGNYGQHLKDEILKQKDEIINEYYLQVPELKNEEAIKFKVDLELDGEFKLRGVLANIYSRSHIRMRPSEIKSKDKLSAWIFHLILQASKIHKPTILLSVDKNKNVAPPIFFEPINENKAKHLLNELIKIFIKGHQSPLPFVLECSDAFASAPDDEQGIRNAVSIWSPNYNTTGKNPSDDLWIQYCWGKTPPFEYPFAEKFKSLAKQIFKPLNEAFSEK